jgi:hypothetical protein
MGAKLDAFHRHLDEHKWCDEHPFHMCQVGQALFMAAGEEVSEGIPFRDTPQSPTVPAAGGDHEGE